MEPIHENTDPVESMGETLEDIKQRLEAIESSTDSSQHNMGVLMELMFILSETKVGKLLLNRAVNRYKLRYLRETVLPRRRKQVEEIMDEEMPEAIQKEFASKELQLVRSATNAVRHREHYENVASDKFHSLRDKLESLRGFQQIWDPKPIPPRSRSKIAHKTV